MFAENYAAHYDLFNAAKPYRDEIEFVYNWAKQPKWIFDVGCGTAFYWKYYPYPTHIVGVDKSKAMISPIRDVICADITTYKHQGRFDCATALFDVINYIPQHHWWKNLPLNKNSYWIFDIWDKAKVDKKGFNTTVKEFGTMRRTIEPLEYKSRYVDLKITVEDWLKKTSYVEVHRMYLFTHKDIVKFCSDLFDIIEVKHTKSWQVWYLCKRK